MRGLASAWLRANCPSLDVQERFLEQFDQAVGRNMSCAFTVGRDLTNSGKAFLVHCFSGELFAFELTAQQAGRLKVENTMLVCSQSWSGRGGEPKAEPVVWLEEVAVDNRGALDRLSPITGTLRYRATQPWLDPLVIRGVCLPTGRGSITFFHHLVALVPLEGTVKFSMGPLGALEDQEGTSFGGAAPLFFQIWTKVERDRHSIPVSPAAHLPGARKPRQPRPGLPSSPQMSPIPSWEMEPLNFDPGPLADPFDPARQAASAAHQERPISDIRAVLADIG
ncbi:MAG TPA: hypothetical protein VGX78_18020 [Pirellulales bacterium]|nr:hypothetical protein [Pirellulales bacterium]